MLKRIANISFSLSFLIAAILFSDALQYVWIIKLLKGLFLVSGSIGLILNLLAYKTERSSGYRYLLFWSSSVILFSGLVLKMMNNSYSFVIIIIGMFLSGISLLLPKDLEIEKEEDMLD